jgi:predicted ATP-grasp superfamily ATP-dependent carboligase
MKKRVLVFPCGSEIGLEIYNSVNHSTHFELYGLSSVKDHGEFLYKNYIDGIGHYNSENFIDELKRIIEDKKIDIVYPAMDSVILFLKYYERELGVQVVGSSYDVAKICSSKRSTYLLLSGVTRVPKLFSKEDYNLTFPLFAKPDIGYGSRNVHKIINKEGLDNIDINEMLLCEYLPGKEYTIDCFTGRGGELSFVGARERRRILNGISVNTKSDKLLTSKFNRIAEKINSQIKFIGAWFFQLKLDSSGEACLLEIACRFAGSSAVHRVKGVNFALSNLYLTVGMNPVFIVNDFDVESDRALNNVFKIGISYKSIFIDYDDTIIIDDKVNLEAIKLIYLAHSFEKKIFLVTKHNGDLESSLRKYKLSNLFTQVIHINESENKFEYIKKLDYCQSIFIDDSFSERRDVFENLKIPVFSVDAIQSLLI